MDYDENGIDYNDSNVDNSDAYDSGITPCPDNISDPDLQDADLWQPYPSETGSEWFHGGYDGYLENVVPTPDDPQQECFYDNEGNLIDEEHKDAEYRGTANQYDGHGINVDSLLHATIDEGGILQNLFE